MFNLVYSFFNRSLSLDISEVKFDCCSSNCCRAAFCFSSSLLRIARIWLDSDLFSEVEVVDELDHFAVELLKIAFSGFAGTFDESVGGIKK